MPRYFFHVHDGISILDEDGTELPDLDAARKEAVCMSGEMLRDHAERFWNGEEWNLDVADEGGIVLFTLMFMGMNSPAISR